MVLLRYFNTIKKNYSNIQAIRKMFPRVYFVIIHMLKNSIPNQYEKSFLEINFNTLQKKMGIKYIILDIDQTIVPQSSHTISVEIKHKIKKIKKLFGNNSICFLTNEPSANRKENIYKQLGLNVVDSFNFKKPLPQAFSYAVDYLDNEADTSQFCFIGDRVWTDILGANNYGLYTIQVDPYDKNSDRYSTKILRYLENYIIKINRYLK